MSVLYVGTIDADETSEDDLDDPFVCHDKIRISLSLKDQQSHVVSW